MSKLIRKAERKSGTGKKRQKPSAPSHIYELWRQGTEPRVDMQISLWYNKEVGQWRWTLTNPDDPMMMESGNSTDVRGAMDDVANTVEWLLKETQEE